MVVADLHVHTTNSDGQLVVEEVPAVAREAGLDAVAVTDHDRLHPDLEAPVEVRDGVTVVHGIELRVDAGDQRVDLLGYGARRTDALVAECERLQRDRVERGRAIVECVEDRLGVSLPVEARPGIGRPHVARAVAEVTEYDVDGAFAELIGRGCPCYRSRDLAPFERGVELLEEACGLVGLAHPLRYGDPEGALSLCESLGAVERWYPYDEARVGAGDGGGEDVDVAPVERAIDRYDLVATGGSDAHDDRLGRAGLDREAWDVFSTAIGHES